MSVARARRAAARVLEDTGLGDTLPIPVEAIARRLGIDVVFRPDFAVANRGPVYGLLVRQEGLTVCVVNKSDAPVRRRFTIAHEIGHFTLHPANDNYVDLRDEHAAAGTDPREIEANAFAAELLMPEKLVRVELDFPVMLWEEKEDEKIRRLAGRFDVSVAAMTIRLQTLGLLH